MVSPIRQSGGPSILYLTPGCFDKGGISRYSRYQVSALRDLFGKAAVQVLSVLGPDEQSFEDAFDVRFAAGGVTTTHKLSYLAHCVSIGVLTRPALIMAAHVNLSGLSRALAKALGARTTLNIYGAEVSGNLRRDARWGFVGMDHVISDCRYTGELVERAGLRTRGSTAVIWDCVDLAKFSARPPSPQTLVKYGIPDPATGLNLLTLGRMSPDAAYKGYERLLEVFARLANVVPDLRLIYAGRGELTRTLRLRADALGLGARVFFTGMIHEDDMADVYRSAHVFSLVSESFPGGGEGVPLTPLEAMACGIPILVGNQDGSQEAIVDNANGFVVDPNDLDAHADKIRLLATDGPIRAAMAQACVATARADFSFEGFREKHRKFLSTWFPTMHREASAGTP